MGMEAANTPVMTQILVLCVAVIRSMPCTQMAEPASVSTSLQHVSFRVAQNFCAMCVCVGVGVCPTEGVPAAPGSARHTQKRL